MKLAQRCLSGEFGPYVGDVDTFTNSPLSARTGSACAGAAVNSSAPAVTAAAGSAPPQTPSSSDAIRAPSIRLVIFCMATSRA